MTLLSPSPYFGADASAALHAVLWLMTPALGLRALSKLHASAKYNMLGAVLLIPGLSHALGEDLR